MAIIDREYLVKAAEEIIRLIEVARKEARFYPAGHPAVREVITKLARELGRATEARCSISFNIAQQEVFLDEIPLPRVTMTRSEFVRTCAAGGISSVTFHAGVSVDELTEFIRLLNEFKSGDDVSHRKGFREMLSARGVKQIDVGSLVPMAKSNKKGGFETPQQQSAHNQYNYAVETIYETCQNLLAGKSIAAESIELAVNGMVRGLVSEKDVYRHLVDVKSYDNYTFNHAVNVALLSLLVGIDIGLNMDQLHRLGVAALLHDVGKTLVPAEVLNKPGKLSPDEWKVMQRHSTEGARLLLDQAGHQDIAVTVAFEHHARYDLSGYPAILHSRDLHLFSRIVGLSDVYDALTSDRSYRRALLPDVAASTILSGSGTDFDPALTKFFVQAVGIFPPGCPVILSNNETAVVHETDPSDLLKPKVRLTSNSGRIIDLRETDLHIKRCADREASPLSS